MNAERIRMAENLFTANGMVAKTALLRENGFFSRDISDLVAYGYIERIRPGYYLWMAAADAFSDVELAAAMIPDGVVCLYSAAVIHELSTMIPTAVTIAIPFSKKTPVLPQNPRIELYRMEPSAFTIGITEMETTFSSMRVHDRERVVCDFFRMRRKTGEDMAMEVLRSYIRGRKDIQRLFEYADALRIKTVMRPYVDALV